MSANKANTRTREQQKITKEIWNMIGIEKAVKQYGFAAVRTALGKWVQFHRENAKLLRAKAEIEARLREIKSKS